MSATLTWLNDLVNWFGRWVPRLTLVPPTHHGVLFGPSGLARLAGSGLILYWPMTHQLLMVPVTVQSVELCARILPLDMVASERMIPRVAMCGLAVQFHIVDAVRAATSVLHIHALIDNRVQASVGIAWRCTAEPFSDTSWVSEACKEAARSLRVYGVELDALDVTHLGIGVALKNMADWSYADTVGGTRPL